MHAFPTGKHKVNRKGRAKQTYHSLSSWWNLSNFPYAHWFFTSWNEEFLQSCYFTQRTNLKLKIMQFNNRKYLTREMNINTFQPPGPPTFYLFVSEHVSLLCGPMFALLTVQNELRAMQTTPTLAKMARILEKTKESEYPRPFEIRNRLGIRWIWRKFSTVFFTFCRRFYRFGKQILKFIAQLNQNCSGLCFLLFRAWFSSK